MKSNFKLFISIFIFIFTARINAHMEEATDSLEGPLDGETEYTENAPMICKLKVIDTYFIRPQPNQDVDDCGGFVDTPEKPFGTFQVNVIGQSGDWIKFTSEETKICPGGFGYSLKTAFDPVDLKKMENEECGQSALDGGRDPKPKKTSTTIESKDKRYSFPLEKCLGIKNKGGLGNYASLRFRNNRRYLHTGTDFYSPRGTLALSPCDGKVTASNYGSTGGNSLVITCKSGDSFKLMHLNNRPQKLTKGTVVSQGDVVGGVGNTGNARKQEPHLHLEALINHKRVDPESLWNCHGDSGH